MRTPSAVFLSALLLGCAVAGQEPAALVTFYSAGCHPCGKELAVTIGAGSATVPYRGGVYDGAVQLVKTMTPNRFITFRMKAGPHSFAGENPNGFKKKRSEGRDLQLNLQPGQHYFIALSMKDKGVYVVRHFTPILMQKECAEAFTEGAQTEPLRPKGIEKGHMVEIVPTPYFPVCDASASPTLGKDLP